MDGGGLFREAQWSEVRPMIKPTWMSVTSPTNNGEPGVSVQIPAHQPPYSPMLHWLNIILLDISFSKFPCPHFVPRAHHTQLKSINAFLNFTSCRRARTTERHVKSRAPHRELARDTFSGISTVNQGILRRLGTGGNSKFDFEVKIRFL